MSFSLLQALVSNNVVVRQDLWHCKGLEIDFPKLLHLVSKLHTQLEVQNCLLSIKNLLQEYLSDKLLPNQQATRIKHFLKFMFEMNSCETSRKTQLHNLDCLSLKLCGLSYTVCEIVELPAQVFDFLVENAEDFVKHHELALLLCRDDINRQQESEFVRPHKHARAEEEIVKNGELCAERLHIFNTPRSQISLLGDLLSDAVHISCQWDIERSLGKPMTDCPTTLIPKDPTQDISITLWVGQEAGLQINDTFNLVLKWTSLPTHGGP
uniref:Uncharacterized protein n=1 Tax=Coccidioides posadasii RMSCC 3488 TaxID=454284 RepID=A0A0J6FB82_COCPO|nr:hypothetical protein CPAG_02854 [Coccidioides posadasii RMSCC 3488]